MNGRHHRFLFDIRFSDGGLRRWITKYIIDHYKCSGCGVSFASDARRVKRHRYGDNLLAYVIYNIIELSISQYKLAKVVHKLFGYSLLQQEISRMMRRAVETYRDAYEEINQEILERQIDTRRRDSCKCKRERFLRVGVCQHGGSNIYLVRNARRACCHRVSRKLQGSVGIRFLFCVQFAGLSAAEMLGTPDA